MKGKKILIWGSAMFVLSGICFASSAQETPVTNLVVNGSFEDSMSTWTVNSSTPAERYSMDNSGFTDGKCSLKLDGTVPLATNSTPYFMSVEQAVELKPSTSYILKVDIKRNTVRSKIAFAVLQQPAGKANEQWDYLWFGENPTKGIDTWEHFELKFKTNPVVDRTLIELYNISSGGIAWFDNIQLTEVSAEKK